MEPQSLDYDIAHYYLPEKWEMVRVGKVLSSDEETQRILRLLIFNLGIKKSLDLMPRQLIEQYLNNNPER
jgi:hypothetical protein